MKFNLRCILKNQSYRLVNLMEIMMKEKSPNDIKFIYKVSVVNLHTSSSYSVRIKRMDLSIVWIISVGRKNAWIRNFLLYRYYLHSINVYCIFSCHCMLNSFSSFAFLVSDFLGFFIHASFNEGTYCRCHR